MRIIGIDPGLGISGYGVIDVEDGRFKLIEAGIIKTSPKDKIAGRLGRIYKHLSEIIKEFKPQAIVVEKIYSHYKHPTTAIAMAHARGVICLVSSIMDVEFFEYPATHVKKAIVGEGHASKYQIQHMLMSVFNLTDAPKYEDITDALALAIAHAHTCKLKNI